MVVTTEMVGLVIAIGTIINAVLAYRIQSRVEAAKQQAAATAEIAKKAELAAIEAATLAKDNAKVADRKMDEIHTLANSNLAAANKRLDDALKRIEDLEKEKERAAPATPAPVATPGLVVEGEIHDLVISNKPVEEKKP